MTLPNNNNITGSGAVNVTQEYESKDISLKSELNRDFNSTDCQVYTKTSGNQFGWTSMTQGSIPSSARTVNAGTGISVESGSTYDTISLSQDVQNKLARIPDLPTGDGNYALTCTISGGVATFAWTPAG